MNYMHNTYVTEFRNIKQSYANNIPTYVYVTGSAKTVLNGTFSISRNTVLKYCNNGVANVLHYSRARLAV